MGKESKKQGVSVWLRPDTITRMDSQLTLDNCSSRSEFMEKAVRFYIGYLTSEDVSEYLSQALVATIKGSMDENSNRQRAPVQALRGGQHALPHHGGALPRG